MKRLGVVMDPIESINTKKDSTFAMLLEAQRRGWPITYMRQGDLHLRDGKVWARGCSLELRDDAEDWFSRGEPHDLELIDLDVILMRKDPPFDMEYVYTTYLLDLVSDRGTLVVNHPTALRDANEKLSTAWFPECCPPTLVSRSIDRLKSFLAEQGDVVVKPLDSMGGDRIFRLRQGDPNTNVILETSTERGRRTIMAQRFLPEFAQGDKRILLIDGEPIPYALARIPAAGEGRANLAAGGAGVGVEINERDRWICDRVGPTLRERGLLFVGLDVIGEFLTEINVTSPTCIRELDAIYGLNISATLFDSIEAKLT